ncbi:alginate lyase family protein [Alteromonas gracilis]|uniref:alginate lyase family protein n=1 Tax=Alteromonas gracilis TaxID=1479524 RepID=UPI0037350331
MAHYIEPSSQKEKCRNYKAWASTFKGFKVAKGYQPKIFLESAWILPIWIPSLDMIKNDLTDWTSDDEREFRIFIKKLHPYARKAHRDNNWGTSAMLADMCSAVYFKDEILFTEQLKKFTYYLKILLNKDGSLNADYLSDPWHPRLLD